MAVCRSTFACARTGRTYVAGDVVADDDPGIPGREAQFELTGAGFRVAPGGDPVEQATAAPGEVRNSTRGRRPVGSRD